MLNALKQFKQRQGFMRYFKNTSWLLGERILRMGVGLFVGIWIARYLGPEQFGLLSYAQSFVFLFTAIATLGLDGIVVRELVKDESKRDVLLGTAFALKLIGAIIILPVLYLAIQFTNNDDYTNLLVFIIASATIFQSFNVIDFYYQSKVLSKYVALANTVVLALSSTIKIVLILNEAPLLAFAAMTIFDGLVLTLGLVYYYRKMSHLNLLNWCFEWGEARNLFKDSWPLFLSGFVTMVYMRIDQVMIKEMINAEAVGQYAAAVKISEALYFIPVVMSNSLFPLILKAKEQGEAFYYERLQRFYTFLLWCMVGITIPLAFIGEWVIGFLFGKDYSQATSVLMIHIWTVIFVSLAVSSGRYLVAENLVWKAFYRNIVGVMTNIVLNFYMIEAYGINGAAFATLISWVFSGYIYDFLDRNLRKNAGLKTKAFVGKGFLF